MTRGSTEAKLASSADAMTLRRCLQEVREVAAQAQRDGVTIDPGWLLEHLSIAIDHPVEALDRDTSAPSATQGGPRQTGGDVS